MFLEVGPSGTYCLVHVPIGSAYWYFGRYEVQGTKYLQGS